MKFQAVMFDFDGTVTPKGQHHPTERIVLKIHEIAKNHPIAFCTGRQLESFEKHGMEFLFEALGENFNKKDFLHNFHLIAENGSIGYYFDLEQDQFQEFYRVPWPEDFMPKETLKNLISEAISELGAIYHDAHKVAVVMRTNLHYAKDKIKEIYEEAAKIYKICFRILKDYDPNFEKHLHIGNSGIGVIICPAQGNKNRGIREFGKYLHQKKGFNLENPYRKILVIGDRPQIGGNDHYFLRGEFGTPFSVGEISAKENPEKINNFPLPPPVITEKNQRLFHEQATFHLLEKYF